MFREPWIAVIDPLNQLIQMIVKYESNACLILKLFDFFLSLNDLDHYFFYNLIHYLILILFVCYGHLFEVFERWFDLLFHQLFGPFYSNNWVQVYRPVADRLRSSAESLW